MDKLRRQEYLLYACVWAIVIAVVHRLGVLSFLLLFLVHNFLLAPLLPKRKALYAILTLALLTLFGFYCFQTGMQPPEFGAPPPPPEGFGPGGPPAPDRAPMPGGPRPLKPEMMRLLLGILTVAVNLGVKAFFLARRSELRVQELEAERETPGPVQPKEETLLFKTGRKTVRVSPDDIRYVESMSEYLKIHLEGQDQPLVVLYSLRRLSAQLDPSRFVRIHRSYLVNLSRVKEVSAHSVTLEDGITLPVSDSYRATLSEQWNQSTKVPHPRQ